jgi:putative restriction endonuclease
MYAVITENDQSQWDDETGVIYHFPKRYATILQPGTRVIYYKGKMKNAAFANARLSLHPHYFGQAVIGNIYSDPESIKGDLFATIESYSPFPGALGIKQGGAYFEVIPPNRESNYWRDGVRTVNAETFFAILAAAGIDALVQDSKLPSPNNPVPDAELESAEEGSKVLRYVTTYERDPKYRRQALAIHGLRCKACDVDMGERYGAYAHGLIHVHHVVPVSTYSMPKKIDPGTELVPVCPNCHAVIHRRKDSTLTIADVRRLLKK